jgi:hypothetical protein
MVVGHRALYLATYPPFTAWALVGRLNGRYIDDISGFLPSILKSKIPEDLDDKTGPVIVSRGYRDGEGVARLLYAIEYGSGLLFGVFFGVSRSWHAL